MSSKFKRPREDTSKHIKGQQQPSVSTDQLPPIFALHQMNDGRYCLPSCQQSDQAQFARALLERSRLTWAQLKCAPRHGMGFEKIEPSQVRQSLPSSVTEDVNLIAFRFSGKAPMVGYRDGQVFHVLWLDHDFSLYDHD
ncbi:MAG: hypothetical protein Q7S58_06025 [Candidatus Binatus sp.]|uniref:hypothetical protein n=1 Tax=Candidatus Binatus sp. TaxID=2811406 RepID=UPI0027171A12|nr:hypothetical protein [Candidatus Binatus sp.]MDO8431953.1 hypothetical protein [Candidatus Binatus sp.]